MYRLFQLLFLLFLFANIVSADAGNKPSITVSILPQKFLVDRVGGGRFDVNVMVGPGESPATYEPKPRQMTGLKSAVLYYRIGVPFEKVWFPKIQAINPQLPVLDAREGIFVAHEHADSPIGVRFRADGFAFRGGLFATSAKASKTKYQSAKKLGIHLFAIVSHCRLTPNRYSSGPLFNTYKSATKVLCPQSLLLAPSSNSASQSTCHAVCLSGVTSRMLPPVP